MITGVENIIHFQTEFLCRTLVDAGERISRFDHLNQTCSLQWNPRSQVSNKYLLRMHCRIANSAFTAFDMRHLLAKFWWDQKIRWVCWLFTQATYSQIQAESSWNSSWLTEPNKLTNIWKRLKTLVLFSKNLATCKPRAGKFSTYMCKLLLSSFVRFVPIGVILFLLALYYLHLCFISNSL